MYWLLVAYHINADPVTADGIQSYQSNEICQIQADKYVHWNDQDYAQCIPVAGDYKNGVFVKIPWTQPIDPNLIIHQIHSRNELVQLPSVSGTHLHK